MLLSYINAQPISSEMQLQVHDRYTLDCWIVSKHVSVLRWQGFVSCYNKEVVGWQRLAALADLGNLHLLEGSKRLDTNIICLACTPTSDALFTDSTECWDSSRFNWVIVAWTTVSSVLVPRRWGL